MSSEDFIVSDSDAGHQVNPNTKINCVQDIQSGLQKAVTM
jgi:hypothetical protein